MSSVAQGNSVTIIVPADRTLEVSTAGEASVTVEGGRTWWLRSGEKRRLALPDPAKRVTIVAISGTANYTVYYTDVVPFTGDRTLSLDDNGKVLRCDDTSNVTITVPADLPECFSCGFLMWSTGTVTLAAGSGATKRSSTSAIGAQYSSGAMLVATNADDASAEFVLSGGFT
ncbi:hypothetical protein EDE08_109355 [Bradyrhizobium sp. R2.2-H]|jgi:hypothetical protein|uniref:hypothetical protein n=1 Tax=Bradyrhizobium sp. R2.2-H TaxID=2485165 RepID=UPI00104AEB74|nr:hypothetical protein [Bradyrhizobium sp. R2.2-H]TCU68248.1 hypothetical protein EDE10_10958 [Bradyrhizobium sp. Y-H1]TCU70130.1 hypothetical protein EDE08_109355 [Bradyrhizobium sp. R2.2-H]